MSITSTVLKITLVTVHSIKARNKLKNIDLRG